MEYGGDAVDGLCPFMHCPNLYCLHWMHLGLVLDWRIDVWLHGTPHGICVLIQTYMILCDVKFSSHLWNAASGSTFTVSDLALSARSLSRPLVNGDAQQQRPCCTGRSAARYEAPPNVCCSVHRFNLDASVLAPAQYGHQDQHSSAPHLSHPQGETSSKQIPRAPRAVHAER